MVHTKMNSSFDKEQFKAPSIKEELNLDFSARAVLNDAKREKLKKKYI